MNLRLLFSRFQFAAGLILGLTIGAAVTAEAIEIIGDNEYLVGWDVLIGGNVVCQDPFMWTGTQEIECD